MSAAISAMDPDAANEGTGPRPHPGREHSCEPSLKQVVEILIESYNWERQSSVPRKASKAQTTLWNKCSQISNMLQVLTLS